MRHPQAGQRAGATEQEDLEELLPRQTPWGCTEGEPDTHLARPCGGAREEEIRDVGAGDSEHECDDCHHDQDGLSIGCTDRGRAGCRRDDHERLAHVLIPDRGRRLGIARRLAYLGLYASERLLRRLARLAILQPRDDSQPDPTYPSQHGVLPAQQLIGLDRDGHVQRSPHLDASKSWSHDADDGEGDALDGQGLADDIRRAAKSPLPERMADDRDRTVRTAVTSVIGQLEGTAEDRCNAEDSEVVSAREYAVDHIWLAVR